MGKKSGPAAPAAPDPAATAAAQATANKETAIAQANLNRINQNTPQGSIAYTVNGTNDDGTPRYTQNVTYSPDEQKKYDQANQIAIALNNLAGDNVTRVADVQNKDFNFNSATPLRTSVGAADTSAQAQRVSDAMYGQMASRLDPRFKQDEGDIRSRLAAQGITENSDAYRREMDNFNRDKTDAYNQAAMSSVQGGAQEQSRLFNIDAAKGAFENSARQQGISEDSYLRNLPLNEIAALMGTGGTVNNPNFQPVAQVGVAAPDYQGAVMNNYNAQMNMYNQRQAARSSALGSVFGALGSVGGALAMSDIRVKWDIKPIGQLANGIVTFAFKYIGSTAQRFGVMAQQVVGIRPEAVGYLHNGLMYVNYGKVW